MPPACRPWPDLSACACLRHVDRGPTCQPAHASSMLTVGETFGPPTRRPRDETWLSSVHVHRVQRLRRIVLGLLERLLELGVEHLRLVLLRLHLLAEALVALGRFARERRDGIP